MMSFNQYIAALQDPLVALLMAGALLAAILLYPTVVCSRSEKYVHQLGFSIQTTLPFFNRRFDFLRSSFKKSGQEIISFKVFHHSVVAMRGEAARKAFLDNRSLDFIDGYDLLLGGTPRLRDLNVPHEQNQGLSWFNKQILSVLSKERISEVLPTLLDDIQIRMEGWGKEGRMDPFKNIPDLIFQITIRVATCRELATDIEAVNKFQQDFSMLERSATSVALLLPWLPTKAKKDEQTANDNLRATVRAYVEKRKEEAPSSDAIDFLLSRGLQTDRIVTCVLSLIWVGVLSASVNACWVLIFLSYNKEWKQRVIAEANSITEKYISTSTGGPLHKQLATIPLSVWEEEMPVLDLVIRETIRLTVDGSLPRHNIHDDLDIIGKHVSKGSFVVYQAADVHMNPDIYTNPTQFDPARFGPERGEDKKEAYAFIGWGAGRHPCTGMRFAKLELKILIVLFLAAYQYDLVNEVGGFPEHLPMPNYNDLHKSQPREHFYFKFKRVVD